MAPFQGYPTTKQILASKLYRPRVRPMRRLRAPTLRSAGFAKAVRRVVNQELKFRRTAVAQIGTDNVAGIISHLSLIARGDDQNQRTGNWIQPMSIYGKVTMNADSVSGVDYQKYRFSIVRWREDANVTIPTLGQILETAGNPHGPYNFASKGKFDVIWSVADSCVPNKTNSKFHYQYSFKRNLSRGPKTLFDDALFKKYHYFVVASSDIAVGANPPQLSFDITLRYTDS